MKAIVTGIAAAALLAVIGALVLDTRLQQSVDERFATTGVRL